VFGVVLIVLAELLDNKHNAKAMPTGPRRGDAFADDAKVFGLRIAGALAIFVGLITFVIAALSRNEPAPGRV
jgi:hypothetical protein